MLGFIERKRSRLKRSRMRRRIQDAGFWFVDIPRTGSTSLKQALGELYGEAFGKRYCRELDARAGDTFFPDHTRAYVVRDLVRQKIWKELFTFSIVRHPLERFYSLYQYRRSRGELATVDFEQYCYMLETPQYRNPDSPFYAEQYHLSMADYLMDEMDQLLVEQVYRQEDYRMMLTELSQRLGVELKVGRYESLNSGASSLSRYSVATADIVCRFYQDDFRLFGYEFPHL